MDGFRSMALGLEKSQPRDVLRKDVSHAFAISKPAFKTNSDKVGSAVRRSQPLPSPCVFCVR